MKTFLCTALALLAVCANGSAQTKESKQMNAKRILIAYFSATGTTARAAKSVANVTGGTLHAITPAAPYTRADLDWNDRRSRSSVEMNDPQARPAIEQWEEKIAEYDIVFLGYPIWWDLAPRILNTFIESLDLRGKTLLPFATSGGSGILHSVAALKRAYPEIDWRNGKLLNGASEKAVRDWVERELGK